MFSEREGKSAWRRELAASGRHSHSSLFLMLSLCYVSKPPCKVGIILLHCVKDTFEIQRGRFIYLRSHSWNKQRAVCFAPKTWQEGGGVHQRRLGCTHTHQTPLKTPARV